MIEKRTVPRRRVFKSGTLAFSGGRINCVVRNLSSSGASLDIASPFGLPPSFMLTIETDRFKRRCRPVWLSENRMGVAFDESTAR
jgi:PilZ domain-containing protein